MTTSASGGAGTRITSVVPSKSSSVARLSGALSDGRTSSARVRMLCHNERSFCSVSSLGGPSSTVAAATAAPVDLLWGIGGTPEGVLTAAAIKCIGGQLLGRLWPRDDRERQEAIDAGYDLGRVLDCDDLVAGDDCFFSATGITDGDVLQGVRYQGATSATTESLVMRSRSGTVRRIHARHDRAKLRSY